MAGAIRTDGAAVAATLLLDAASRKEAARARVNHTGSPGQDPEHENLQTLVT